MTIAGGFQLPFGTQVGATASRRSDGAFVLDVSAPFLGRTSFPLFALCPKCLTPVEVRQFRLSEIPVPDSRPRVRCARGHGTVLPDYLMLIDNTPRGEPRMLHVRRPTETFLLRRGWLTQRDAQRLVDAAHVLVNGGTDDAVEDALRAASYASPQAEVMLRNGKASWTRDQKIAVAAVLVAILGVLAPLLINGIETVTQLQELVEQQQRLIEIQNEQIRDSHPDEGP